jgi:hypothetical protein
MLELIPGDGLQNLAIVGVFCGLGEPSVDVVFGDLVALGVDQGFFNRSVHAVTPWDDRLL